MECFGLAWVLIIVGGLNWGLVGFFHFDLVATLFGSMSVLSRLVYGLVGLGAVWQLVSLVIKSSNGTSRA